MASPLISLLRPVSPLAWLPIGLLVFKAANPAAIWVDLHLLDLADDHQHRRRRAARAAGLPERRAGAEPVRVEGLHRASCFPAVLPYMLTGVRLSVGTAWLVIVAAEMLTGGVGIGFWVWDEWNNLNVEHIIIAIFVIGIVGLLLEQAADAARAPLHLRRRDRETARMRRTSSTSQSVEHGLQDQARAASIALRDIDLTRRARASSSR